MFYCFNIDLHVYVCVRMCRCGQDCKCRLDICAFTRVFFIVTFMWNYENKCTQYNFEIHFIVVIIIYFLDIFFMFNKLCPGTLVSPDDLIFMGTV